MISINQRKLITSLHQKKYREKNGLFFVEGEKLVNEMVRQATDPSSIEMIVATEEYLEHGRKDRVSYPREPFLVSESEMEKLSTMVSSPGIMAISRIPERIFEPSILKQDHTFLLESIRDPGNLGTIIRTADWFGFRNILCSNDSVDAYNPKAVQASMGAVLRVAVYYGATDEFLRHAAGQEVQTIGSSLDGEDMQELSLDHPALFIMGNESSGISPMLQKQLDKKIRINDYPPGTSGTESLNLAISTALIMAELRRAN